MDGLKFEGASGQIHAFMEQMRVSGVSMNVQFACDGIVAHRSTMPLSEQLGCLEMAKEIVLGKTRARLLIDACVDTFANDKGVVSILRKIFSGPLLTLRN